MEKFDLLNVPLQGINLLEAGAGTGKTFTIEGLCLRLITEKAMPVGEILVVTYTVAATEELRDRIRRRLVVAAAAFASGESEDALLQGLLTKHPGQGERLLFRERLRTALRDFDEAAIFTIHSFCQRILQENAFESDSLFDTELITDERRLRAELVDDFWRRHFYETLPEVAGYALACGFNRDTLAKLLGKVLSHADLSIIPRIEPPSRQRLSAQAAALSCALDGLRAAWPEVRQEVNQELTSPALNATVYGRRVEGLIRAMDSFVAAGGGFPLFADFEKFTAPVLAARTRKNCEPPQHDFFCLCGTVQEQAAALVNDLDRYLLSLKAEFVLTAQKKLADRKKKDNVMFFDDLLSRLRAALQEQGGPELARIVGQKYRAALIDEFQDTDPVQFAIFRELFGRQEGEQTLFLIGDPKQAIYSFRGADIFAYMKAAAGVKGKYTIVENWRSEPDLIRGVNSLFKGRENPFVYREIAFRPAERPPGKLYDFFTLSGRREAPLRLWFVPAEKYGPAGKALAKEIAQPLIVRAVAAEIARLIGLSRQGRALIGKRALREDDIAVLVRKHREARLIQEALGRLKIPAVIGKTGNIFDTREAEELEMIMRALAAPQDERLVRAALLTDILGVGIASLDRLTREEKDWGKWLEKFSYYHDLWFEAGFMGMFAALLAGEEIKLRLLAFPDGERRITNLLQLAELLQRRSETGQRGVTGLCQWLGEQRNPATPRLDEHQLRLESDERAVQIVTIHQSKGLEYPVVFCPFTWEGSEIKGDAFSFHGRPGEGTKEGSESGTVICDLGSVDSDANRARAARESLAENMRLLYVALTRARHRCYLVWGRFNKAETSAPAYLFHGGPGLTAAGREDGVVADLAEHFGQLADETLYRELENMALTAEGAIALAELPTGSGEILPLPEGKGAPLTFKAFAGKIDRSWRMMSFSSLVSGAHQLEEKRDYDSAADSAALGAVFAASSPGEEGNRDIFSFPRGARAGTLLHEILRYLDFQDLESEETGQLVSRELSFYGFPSFWKETILDLLRKVVAAPLLPFSAAGARPFTLASLPLRDRMNELEFYFPLRRLAPEDLPAMLGGVAMPWLAASEAAGRDRRDFSLPAGRLHFSPGRGFMRGFMDLAFSADGRFYLVDWKSNYLGNQLADYGQKAIAGAMGDNFYVLQYHLYCLALHLYLGARLPGYRYDSHFGGVYYFFLRGIDPAAGPENGIYRDRPPEELITALATKLIARS